MECKFCGEKDQNRMFISVSAINGKITSDIVMCFRCYWREKFEREKNKEDELSRQREHSKKLEKKRLREYSFV